MLLFFTRVGPSKIEGLGCFAAEPIPRGRKVWSFHDSIDMRTTIDSVVSVMPSAAKRAWQQYAYNEDGWAILPGDDARFINHSTAPNIGALPLELPECDFALVDIAAGAELLCDYRKFGPGLCAAFLDPPL